MTDPETVQYAIAHAKSGRFLPGFLLSAALRYVAEQEEVPAEELSLLRLGADGEYVTVAEGAALVEMARTELYEAYEQDPQRREVARATHEELLAGSVIGAERPVPKLNRPRKVDPERFEELRTSEYEIVRDLLQDLITERAIVSIQNLALWHLARQLRGDQRDIAERTIAEIRDPVAVVPCPQCGGELYDSGIWDEKRNRAICPSCWQVPGV